MSSPRFARTMLAVMSVLVPGLSRGQTATEHDPALRHFADSVELNRRF